MLTLTIMGVTHEEGGPYAKFEEQWLQEYGNKNGSGNEDNDSDEENEDGV